MSGPRWTVILRENGIDGVLEQRFNPLPKGIRSDETRRLMYGGLRYEQLEKSGLLQYYGISFDDQGNLIHDPSAALASLPGSFGTPSQQQIHQPAASQPESQPYVPPKQSMRKKPPVMPTAETNEEKVARLTAQLHNN
ncbi:hypothetical protein IAQ67_28535 (plasmid) [Paenibacillus peoriae]|uniref:Uncharacterized protein n=1 Tax=Paenibacillus peoriae TaxID=59893 RepID=A0A7H0YHA3_9BACL|nr:hypothetical protein [Paenibacillus peoriae]QNR70461.1 hypothetical protein IAQ67_28535 [Paenibacillus peoriae]